MHRQKQYHGGMKAQHATRICLHPDANRLLAALAQKPGTDQTAVLALMIRAKVKHEGVK